MRKLLKIEEEGGCHKSSTKITCIPISPKYGKKNPSKLELYTSKERIIQIDDNSGSDVILLQE